MSEIDLEFATEANEANEAYKANEDNEAEELVPRISHFNHKKAHSPLVRYGFVVALSGIFGLLLTADLASGITFFSRSTLDGSIRGLNIYIDEVDPEETVTIFSSMKQSWDIGAKGTAVIIFIASIWWPYAKLFLLGCFWFVPFNPFSKKGKMECSIEFVELFGKWSFVDIYLFIILIVAFDITSETSGTISVDDGVNINGTMTSSGETKTNPRWGMSLFTFTSVFALLASHFMLWTHRQVFYERLGQDKIIRKEAELSKETLAQRTGKNVYLAVFLLISALVLDYAGYFMNSVEFIMKKPNIANVPEIYVEADLNMTLIIDVEDLLTFTKDISMSSVGVSFLDGTKARDTFNVRVIQFFYYIMTIVAPTFNILIYVVLYSVPLTKKVQKIVFHAGEFAYAWNAYGVMAIVLGVASFQIPSFNEETEKCGVYCHITETALLNGYIVITMAWLFQLVTNYIYGNAAHKALYISPLQEK